MPRTWLVPVKATQALFVLFLIAVVIFKFSRECCFIPYFIHFTNWAWTLLLVFLLVDVVLFLNPDWVVYTFGWTFLVFFLTHAVAWAVAIGVTVLLLVEDTFLANFTEEFGVGLVTVGNSVYHTWPLIAILLYAALHYPLLSRSVQRQTNATTPTWGHVLVISVGVASAAFLLFVAYLLTLQILNTTLQMVYSMHLPTSLAIGALLGITFLTTFILLVIFKFCGVRSTYYQDELYDELTRVEKANNLVVTRQQFRATRDGALDRGT